MKTLCCLLLAPSLLLARPVNEALEPAATGKGSIELTAGSSLDKWTAPSERWTISDGVISGDTSGEILTKPEWLYTRGSFRDFIFTTELRLSEGPGANSGIYFRVKPFPFVWKKTGASYEAPSGYEYDAALGGKHNGSLGDWYARPSLRLFPDPALMVKTFKPGDWNRMTIRARGNRLEYWLNGAKIMDYTDHDPARSPEGLIGIQIHDGLAMKVELRNAAVLPLTSAEN